MELLACLSHMRQVLGILRRRSPKARGQAKGWGRDGRFRPVGTAAGPPRGLMPEELMTPDPTVPFRGTEDSRCATWAQSQ